MSAKYSISVRGKHREWAFTVRGTPEHAADWRADGLDVVEIEYTIPAWVVAAGLVTPWVFGADIIKWLKS